MERKSFGSCGQPTEVVLFYCSKLNIGKVLTIYQINVSRSFCSERPEHNFNCLVNKFVKLHVIMEHSHQLDFSSCRFQVPYI